MNSVQKEFGNIDIYLFDQILKGRFAPGSSILDAGCGTGRNLVYFLRNNFKVFAVDRDVPAVEDARRLAGSLGSSLPADNFQHAVVEALPCADASFDAVISSAVLHFSRDQDQFNAMLADMWRVLRSGGLFFARLASSIGIEKLINYNGPGRYLLPDGTERFLVDEKTLIDLAAKLGGALIEPIKTTNVQNLRCMTTWVVRKRTVDEEVS